MELDNENIVPEYITKGCFQAVTLDELRRLLYPREITMKELNRTKGCKSLRIHEDDQKSLLGKSCKQ